MENKLVMPRHIAIIMDGNGRWAQKRSLNRCEGHREGAEALKRLIEGMKEFPEVEYMTFYAFSTENWKRSKEEVSALMSLLVEFLDANLPLFQKNDLRLLVTGRPEGLPEEPRKKLADAIGATSNNKGLTVIMALNYGGRSEIADAAKNIARKAASGELDPEKVDEALFAQYLYNPQVPDPDLLIRTSGELRLSNFLLWEISYSEIYVTDTLWPDFDKNELLKAMESFGKRSRRFGGR
ncbi:MAG: isoprenyl transferase [Lentisphaeria bacterium]|nr:isoprenyl transferase [Lentisphaeria bacterium]